MQVSVCSRRHGRSHHGLETTGGCLGLGWWCFIPIYEPESTGLRVLYWPVLLQEIISLLAHHGLLN